MKLGTLGFLAIVCGLPLGQAAVELARGERPQVLDVAGPLEERRLRAFEDDLHAASIVRRELVPRLQGWLARWLRRGNERVLFGSDDWLFLDEDVDFVTGPGLLEPGVGGRRALEAIVGFRDALAARGIELLVVPVPTKAVACGRFLAPELGARWPDNPDAPRFFAELANAGVHVLDLRALYADLRASSPELYLRHDTHWRPETMRAVAERIAERVEPWLTGADARRDWLALTGTVAGAGDTLAMLSLPEGAAVVPPEEVAIDVVVDAHGGAAWSPDPGAEVLLLGDSFTKVFSDERLGHGAGAGLGEQLARALARGVDVIAMPGGGALAPREALAQRAHLSGKRVVVFEFTERELVAGPERWKPVPLPSARAPDDRAPSATAPAPPDPEEPADAQARVVAEIVAISEIGPDFDYDFCLGIFTYELLSASWAGEPGDRISVAFTLVDDWKPTPAAAFAPGDRHELELAPIEEHHDLEATCWVDDTDGPLTIFLATAWEALD